MIDASLPLDLCHDALLYRLCRFLGQLTQCTVEVSGTCDHTSYLSRTLRTLSVEQQISCGAILLHMEIFDGLVEQNRFTWQAILPHKTKLFVLWSNFVMWINDKLVLVPNFAVRDKFKMYAVLKWFTLFWREINFLQFTHFCVEQKITQKSCPWSKNDKYDVCRRPPYTLSLLGGIPLYKSVYILWISYIL